MYMYVYAMSEIKHFKTEIIKRSKIGYASSRHWYYFYITFRRLALCVFDPLADASCPIGIRQIETSL